MPIYRIAIDAEEPWYEFEADNAEQAISIYNQLKHELVKPYQKLEQNEKPYQKPDEQENQ
jgi:hypothetical protein